MSEHSVAAWPRVSVVVPAMNEERNLPHVFARIPAGVHEVILVDGNSVDDTVAVARQLRPDIRVVQQTRRGKGNALACGFEAATGDVIAMIDADCSTDPAEIPHYVDALRRGAGFAKGTRYALGGGSEDITPVRSLGNRALTGLFNLLFRTRHTDLCYGFNVFWAEHTAALALDARTPQPADGSKLWGDGFEIETLIQVRVAAAGIEVAEVGSFERNRLHGESNLSAVSDGLRVLRTMLTGRMAAWRQRRGPQPAPAARPALTLAPVPATAGAAPAYASAATGLRDAA